MVKFVRESQDDRLNHPLLDPLFQDLVECEFLLDKDGSQFARRAFVRACFAFTEAWLYWFRGETLSALVSSIGPRGEIPFHKIAMLSDEVARVTDRGTLKIEPARIGFRNYLRFVLQSFADIIGYDTTEIFGDDGWREVKAALEVRHRITHPKAPEDLNITDDEIETLRGAMTWLYKAPLELTDAYREKVEGVQSEDLDGDSSDKLG